MLNLFTFCLQTAQELQFGQSLFERLFSFLDSPSYKSPVQMLDTQYRMHKEIVSFPSMLCYDGALITDRLFNVYNIVYFNVIELSVVILAKFQCNRQSTQQLRTATVLSLRLSVFKRTL